MKAKKEPSQSHLFTLRIWVEEMGDGRVEFRGQIKHISSAEIAYFRKWSDLQSFLKRQLQEEVGTNATM